MAEYTEYPELRNAVLAVAGRCNFATSQDGKGFNKFDAGFGHALADMPTWSPQMAYKGYLLLRKYRKQLAAYGIAFESLPVPAAPSGGKIIAKRGMGFGICFDYNAALVAAVKAEVPHVRFFNNGTKYWLAPATAASADAVFTFADKHGFGIDPDVFTYADELSQAPAAIEDTADVPPPISPRRARIEGSKIRITFPYDPDLVAAIKALAGARFDGGSRSWTVPIGEADGVLAIGEKHGFDLGELGVKAAEVRAQRQAVQKAESSLTQKLMDTVDLAKPLPGGKTLYTHQQAGVERIFQSHRQIVADDMGLGKTLTALVAAKAYHDVTGCAVIVLAPISLRDNWFREAEQVEVAIEVHSWSKVPKPPTKAFVLIADEAHYAQNLKSQRTKGFLELADKALAVLPMTGTPIKNGRPANLYPLLVAVRHPLSKNRKEFEKFYCNAGPTKWSRWDVTGAAHLDDLHEKTRDVILRRMKKDCLDLPAKTRVIRRAELSKDAQAQYDATFESLRADYQRRLDAGEIMDGGEALVLLNHLRHAGSVAKVETAIEIAEEIVENGGQVVLFTEFKESAGTLHRKLGGELLTGETPTDKRQGLVDRFQSGQSKVFVGTIKAGGVGITLTAAQTVILVDRPWTSGDVIQAEDRLHRIGQTSNVTSIWLQADECDVKIDALLEAKQKRIDLVLTGQRKTMRGLDSAKDIAAELVGSILH